MSKAGDRRPAAGTRQAAPARQAALAVCLRFQRAEEAGHEPRVRDLLRDARELEVLDARDRALATALATCATRVRGAADALVASHLRKSGGRARDLDSLDPALRGVLRLGAAELVWLGHPARVAVSEAVLLARQVAPKAAGLANAVLRRVADEDLPAYAAARGRLAAGEAGDALVDDAKLVGALPAWLAWELGQSLGGEGLARLALGAMEPPCPTAAVNLAALDVDEAVARLAGEGLVAGPGPLPGSLDLDGYAGLAASPLLAAGHVVPADLAAQLVALVACPRRDARLLEVGQGRGTKSLLLQSVAAARGIDLRIEAIEADGRKVAQARQRLGTAGLAERVSCHELDGRVLADEDSLPGSLRGPFEVVFLDAPCTGTGTLRRHPEIAWRLRRSDADQALPKLQLDLLRAAAARVAPGGDLLYATCSELAQEDEGLVAAFLAGPEGEGFQLAPVRVPPEAGEAVAGMLTPQGCLRTSAGSLGCDGHFLARLVRRA